MIDLKQISQLEITLEKIQEIIRELFSSDRMKTAAMSVNLLSVVIYIIQSKEEDIDSAYIYPKQSPFAVY